MSELTDSLTKQTTNNSLGAAAASADAISALGQASNSAKGILNSDGSITQTERLLTARARYGKTDLLTSNGQDKGGNRGEWAYIKLLTSPEQARLYSGDGNGRQVTAKELIGPSSIVSEMSDPSGNKTTGYDKFLITGVSAQMSEKMQVTEVFGDHEVVYYFGRSPVTFNLSGILIDSPDNNWFYNWLTLYSDFLRGSQLAKNYELLKIVLPNMAIIGTITGFSWAQDASRAVDVPFSFQFLAKVIEPTPATGTGMITSNRLAGVDFSKVASFTGQSAINSLKNQISAATSVLQNPNASLYDRANAMSAIGSGSGGAFGSWLEETRGSLTGFQKTIEGWDKSRAGYFNEVKSSAIFQSVTSSLTGIRMNLFSPVYGIMSSLMRLVSNTANSANNLVNSLVNPVRNILRDITNISNQAVALVNLVNNSIRGFGRNTTGSLKGLSRDFDLAIKSLGKAAGAIGTAPVTIAESVAAMFTLGALPYNPAFLSVGSGKLTVSRPTLPMGKSTPPERAILLAGVRPYNTNLPRLS